MHEAEKKLNRVVLKPKREKPLLNSHMWIFSGAVASLPEFNDGSILPVYSSDEKLLGSAYFNKRSSIIGRMVAFGDVDPIVAIKANLAHAVKCRSQLFAKEHCNGYRLINGEGDSLPGLVVDRYDDVLVMQIGTLGMEKLKPLLIEWFVEHLTPLAIYEKSNLPTRKEEGLPPSATLLYGADVSVVDIIESGLKFSVDIPKGQKTGFFFDQREMRKIVQTKAHGKRVLNCFSYTGGFSIYALAGGASHVDSVDISESAIALAEQNAAINGFGSSQCSFYSADVFEFLRDRKLNYDLVILDPPAFAKKQKDVVAACRGYKEINRLAMKNMPKGSLLLTCSCSFHVDSDLFQKVVFQAAVEAGRTVRIIGHHTLACDHPINICHPEGEYLKSLLLYLQ